jgi:hypothetical protein
MHACMQPDGTCCPAPAFKTQILSEIQAVYSDSDLKKTVWELLEEPVRMDLHNETVYGLIWPFPHCEECKARTRVDHWFAWTRQQQYSFMEALFPSPASRFTNIVSDECVIKSMMIFYGLTGLISCGLVAAKSWASWRLHQVDAPARTGNHSQGAFVKKLSRTLLSCCRTTRVVVLQPKIAFLSKESFCTTSITLSGQAWHLAHQFKSTLGLI